ncbi:MAG: sugar phosphate isomerase/epimerase family protein [Armatimonadota bacterium]
MDNSVRFAICNELFQGWEFGNVCRFAAETGYDALELAPFTLAEDATSVSLDQRRRIRQMAEERGLRICGLHWLLVAPPGLYINHPDREVRERTVRYLIGLVHLCADLGGEVMVFGSPAQRRVHPAITYEEAWKLALDSVREVTDALAECGVTLCMESLPATDTDFLVTAQETACFVREVGHPNVRMIADVKSMCSEGRPEDIIRAHGGMIAHVHANDANRRGPGFGDVDFRPIAAALRDVGFKGYVSVEVFDYDPGPDVIARESLRYLRECFESVKGGHS